MMGTNGSNPPASASLQQVGKVAREGASYVASSAVQGSQAAANRLLAEPTRDIVSLFKQYATDHPDVVAFWCFVAGAFVGWRLRR
jgi:hypothetical protein